MIGRRFAPFQCGMAIRQFSKITFCLSFKNPAAADRGKISEPIADKGVSFMKQCMDADNLHRRLKKIIGQVQAIDRMVDEDIPCEDILSQINAAKSALHRVGQVVLEGHIKHCVRDGIEHGDADQTIENFTKAVERFANMN